MRGLERMLPNNAFEWTVEHRGPRLAAAQATFWLPGHTCWHNGFCACGADAALCPAAQRLGVLQSAARREAVSKQKLPETLQLVRGDAILGTIQVKPSEDESPWHSGEFRATAEFEPVRELFEYELKLLRANTSNDSAQWDDWEAAHAELHE